MKPITEEHRQELIEFILAAQGSMQGNDPVNTERFDIEKLTGGVFEIALASLTAEPVGNVVSMTCINGGLTEARVSMYNPGIPTTLHDVYTAPPVLVIKLPEYQKLLDHPAVMSRWNQCIDEVKRLNGIDV